MSIPHHCRFGCAGSKSGSDGGFWTGSDIQIWRSEWVCNNNMRWTQNHNLRKSHNLIELGPDLVPGPHDWILFSFFPPRVFDQYIKTLYIFTEAIGMGRWPRQLSRGGVYSVVSHLLDVQGIGRYIQGLDQTLLYLNGNIFVKWFP
jgi:hypothetical protein